MNIAAQLTGTELKIFVEDSTWKKTTLPFNREQVKVELVVFITDNETIFHDAVSTPVPVTDSCLMFCWESLTVAMFKQKLKKAGFGEPYEVRLRNDSFALKKNFTGAYTITFTDYANNRSFTDWLVNVVPTLEAGLMLKRLRDGRRYYTKDFAEFREFTGIEEFMHHRFDLWNDAIVKEFEEAVANGTIVCDGCIGIKTT